MSFKGRLLLASPDMLDPNFARTVSLLVEHSDDGALGLVLNRPTEVDVATAWAETMGESCVYDGRLYRGGPCPGPLMVLHTDHAQADAIVTEDICFSTDRDKVATILNGDLGGPVRCFVNYAGWGGGQLEGELDEGVWALAPSSVADVFSDNDIWLSLWRRINPAQAALVERPQLWPTDPRVN